MYRTSVQSRPFQCEPESQYAKRHQNALLNNPFILIHQPRSCFYLTPLSDLSEFTDNKQSANTGTDNNYLPHTKYPSGSLERLIIEKDLQLIWKEWTNIEAEYKKHPEWLTTEESWRHYENYLHRTTVARNHAARYIRLQQKKALYLLAPVEPLVYLSEFKWPTVPKPRNYRGFCGPIEYVMANRQKYLNMPRKELLSNDPGLYRTLARERKLDMLFPNANPKCVENGRRGGTTRHSQETINLIIQAHDETSGNCTHARKLLAKKGINCSCGTILRHWKKKKLPIGKKYRSQKARKKSKAVDAVAVF